MSDLPNEKRLRKILLCDNVSDETWAAINKVMHQYERDKAELDRLRLLAWEGGACPECELESKIEEFGN